MIVRSSLHFNSMAARQKILPHRRHLRPTRLLVADCKPVLRAGVKTVVEGAGFVVASEASNSQEVFSKLSSCNADVVTLDPALPGRGLDMVADLKRNYPQIAVLVYAAQSQQQVGLAAIRAGADGFLLKEEQIDRLLLALEKLSRGEQYIPDSLAAQLVAGARGQSDASPHERLSARERHVLLHISAGLSLKEIGAELSIDAKTVSTYRTRILTKMNMSTNADLIHYIAQLENHLPAPDAPSPSSVL